MVSGRGESLVFDTTVHYLRALAGGTGDRGAVGVGLDGAGVGEAGTVVAEFGQYACAGELAHPGAAGDDLGVGVLEELRDGGFGPVRSRRCPPIWMQGIDCVALSGADGTIGRYGAYTGC